MNVNILAVQRKLRKELIKLEKQRDALRGIQQEVEAIIESVDRAYEDLSSCVDTLSEYV